MGIGSGLSFWQADVAPPRHRGRRTHSWWSTDEAHAAIDLSGNPVLPGGWAIAFHRAWHGRALWLTDAGSSLTQGFTPAARERRVTSTAATARVVLSSGSATGFSRARHALAAGSR